MNNEKTIELAEKYRNDKKKVELCELTNNRSRLYELLENWNTRAFLEVAFKWYVEYYRDSHDVKRFALFDVFEYKYPLELEEFLKEYYPKLLWLLYIRQRKNDLAAPEILGQASKEPQFSALKVT